MAIYRLLKNSTLEPEEISRITKAYEQTLHTLCVKDRDDPLTEMIAKQIIKIAQAVRRYRAGRVNSIGWRTIICIMLIGVFGIIWNLLGY